MTDGKFKVGDEVVANGMRGFIIDMRPAAAGAWIYSVEDTHGSVTEYTRKALTPAKP